MDVMELPEASMRTFTFHGWLVAEVFTDDGFVGLGNAALAPQATKQVIDLYLKPLLIGQDPWDIERLWQHMYRRTMAFGRKGIGMVAISALDIALWDVLGKSAKQPVFRLLGGRTKTRIPVYASRLYATELGKLAAEAKCYNDEGYRAMKLRFGWGPADGAHGMQRNVELVRTVRESIGDEIDLMADAYMGWNLDYAKRMLPLLEPFHLRWLEEPVIPDDVQGRGRLCAGRLPPGGSRVHRRPLSSCRYHQVRVGIRRWRDRTLRIGELYRRSQSAIARAWGLSLPLPVGIGGRHPPFSGPHRLERCRGYRVSCPAPVRPTV